MSDSINTVLHTISQGLLIPCLVVLFLLVLLAVWQTGDLLVERLTERRRLCAAIPELMRDLHAHPGAARDTVAASALLRRHKKALGQLLDAGRLPADARTALARELLAREESRCARTTSITDMGAKLGPMFGLLGTLIPLGPGIVALGQGDTALLSRSLATAFDTTIIGVSTAAVCAVLSQIRKHWYDSDLAVLEAVMECILAEEADHAA